MHDPVDMVREGMAAVTRRDIPAVEALVSDDLVFESTFAGSEGRTFHGPTAVRDYFEALDEAFEHLRVELVEVLGTAGPRVVITARVRGRGRASGMPMEHVYGQIYTVRGDEIAHIKSFMEPADALRAAGLMDGA